MGGRFDQTIASINVLYMMKDEVERRFILVSDDNLTILLDEVKYIKINKKRVVNSLVFLFFLFYIKIGQASSALSAGLGR